MWNAGAGCDCNNKTTTNLFAADKYILSITDIDINYTAAGCQGAIQLSMLAAYNFNNNVLL